MLPFTATHTDDVNAKIYASNMAAPQIARMGNSFHTPKKILDQNQTHPVILGVIGKSSGVKTKKTTGKILKKMLISIG